MNKDELIKETSDLFQKQYSSKADVVSLAPGRVNIIGEHTDYNGGLALPVAIDMYVCIALRENKNNLINAYSVNLDKYFSSDINEKIQEQLWIKYVRGSADEIYKKYNIKKGIDILIHSNLPMESGLSSSAALEISLTNGIIQLFHLTATDQEKIKLSQRVDHNHINIKSGTLDQSASQLSKEGYLLKLDFDKNKHEYIENNCSNCSWVIVDSMVKRELAESKYHERVLECNKALELVKVALGEKANFNSITPEDLKLIMPSDSILYKRAKHIIDENYRVKEIIKFFHQNNLTRIGTTLIKSHESLRDKYQVSCPEIDYIIDSSLDCPSWYGGRIMGGGFGGNTINLVRKGEENIYTDQITKKYLDKFKKIPKIRIVSFVGGAEIVDNISVR